MQSRRANRERQIQARKDLDAATELEAQRRLSVPAAAPSLPLPSVMTLALRFGRMVTLTHAGQNMKTAATPTKRAPRETLNLRIAAAERGLIDRAAQASGKTRTDFILSAARRAAEEQLLDRTIFVVSPASYSKFLAMLDAPPRPNERLRRTMQAPPPWSKA